jgi:hypothetical protein
MRPTCGVAARAPFGVSRKDPIGNSCNFCTESSHEVWVFEITSGGVQIRICLPCFQQMEKEIKALTRGG